MSMCGYMTKEDKEEWYQKNRGENGTNRAATGVLRGPADRVERDATCKCECDE